MKKSIFPFIFLMVAIGCKEKSTISIKEGAWLGEMVLMDEQILPFTFKLIKDGEGKFYMESYNADEILQIDEIYIKGDSITIKMPVFEGYIKGKFTASNIHGSFNIESLGREVPFRATYGIGERFQIKDAPTENISGIWETEFGANTLESYMGKGILTQNKNKVTGTFRTTTGDYRYLDGVVEGDSLKLSTFDGAHLYLFKAKVTDSTLDGTFYSGNHYKVPFSANRNEGFELPDANSLTFLKQGHDRLSFAFPDTDGKIISLDDARFRDKVVIVQIMGSWCPNCLDETKFLVQYLQGNPSTDLKIVALAFEYAKTEGAAFGALTRLKERIGVEYPILLAQYGSSNKARAQEKLPMLNHILSYPTTIYLDKKGKVRKIQTGFNGPATGEKYTDFKQEFADFVASLLKEGNDAP